MALRTHIVGSVNADDVAAAIDLIADELGDTITTMPFERRHHWVIEFIEQRAQDPRYRILRRSRMSEDRDLRPLLDPPRAVPRRGVKVTADILALPYAAEAAYALPHLRSHLGLRPEVRPQSGIADPMNVAAFFWLNPTHHYDAEAAAAQREIRDIRALAPDTVFQWEGPLQTVAVAKAPRRLQAVVAARFARRACEFIAQSPEGTEWILHLCYGNKNDSPLVSPRDAGPAVELANAMWTYWPHGQILNAIHLPLGDRHHPTPYSRNFYYPTGELIAPATVHVSAGFVRAMVLPDHPHWDAQLEQHRWAWDAFTRMANRDNVGVSTSCGWERQPGFAAATAKLLSTVAHF
jgi:hypothetical protein